MPLPTCLKDHTCRGSRKTKNWNIDSFGFLTFHFMEVGATMMNNSSHRNPFCKTVSCINIHEYCTVLYIQNLTDSKPMCLLGRHLWKVFHQNSTFMKIYYLMKSNNQVIFSLWTYQTWIFHFCPITFLPEKFGKVENPISEGPEFKAMSLCACN